MVTSEVAVSRSSAASARASLGVRTEWPSLRPSSHTGYQMRSAMAPMPLTPVCSNKHVEIALRGQLAPAVAADGDEGHPVGARRGQAVELAQPGVDPLPVGP